VFQFAGREVGDEVGLDLFADKEIIAGEDDFGHDVAFVPVVFEVGFGAQIIKAIVGGAVWAFAAAAVLLEDGITVFYEFETEVSRILDGVFAVGGAYGAHEPHQGALAATYRTAEEDSLLEVDVPALRCFFVV